MSHCQFDFDDYVVRLLSIRMKTLAVSLLAALCIMPGAAFAQTSAASSTEARVRAFFADIPAMIAIAKCESGFTQFNASGTVLHGGTGHHMIGIFQINATVHRKGAQALGFDINTTAGNLAYARYLFEQEGTAPWFDSSACWKPIVSAAKTTVASTVDNAALIARLQFQITELSQKFALLRASTSTLSTRVF
jgi:hypothetical protein